VNTHMHAKSGWVERKRIAFLFIQSLSVVVSLVPCAIFVAKHEIPKMIIMQNEQWKIRYAKLVCGFIIFNIFHIFMSVKKTSEEKRQLQKLELSLCLHFISNSFLSSLI
jgi:hypothetical protein